MLRKQILSFCLASLAATSFASDTETPVTSTIIDLKTATPLEDIIDPVFYDESYYFAPHFALDQYAENLSSLFATDKTSHLGVPASLAHALIYLQRFAPTPLSDLDLAGYDKQADTIDYAILVKSLAKAMPFFKNQGVCPHEATEFTKSYFESQGYSSSEICYVPHPSVSELRAKLSKKIPLILFADELTYNETEARVERLERFSMLALGYDWDSEWQDNQILLRILRADLNNALGIWLDGDTYFLTKPEKGLSPEELKLFPYIIRGRGISSPDSRPFLSGMIVLEAKKQDATTN